MRGVEVDAAKLKRLRERRVLSQREVARLYGLTQATVWRLENGRGEARPATVRKLASLLGVERTVRVALFRTYLVHPDFWCSKSPSSASKDSLAQ